MAPPDDTPDRQPGDNPFEGLPLFGDLARMLSSQLGGGAGGTSAAARQFGVQVATDGRPESNVDPLVRIRIEELARVAELHVARVTGLTVPSVGTTLVDCVTRSAWVDRTLTDERDLFERLTGSLARTPDDEGPPDPDDPLAMFAPLMALMAPAMVSLATGSMVGNLAKRSFGQYDLPVPRPEGAPVLLLPGNIDAFANDWSLPADDVRLWVCLHELAHHAVLGVPHVGGTLRSLLLEYVGGFRPDAPDLAERLGDMDPASLDDPSALGGLLGSPDVLLGAIRSPAQEALMPRLEAIVSVVVGVVDHVMDTIGSSLLSDYRQLTEALRRRRVEATEADRFVERLLGLEMNQRRYDQARHFVDGVVERAGADGLARLWEDVRNLPTPAEIEAPGLWLARIDLPVD